MKVKEYLNLQRIEEYLLCCLNGELDGSGGSSNISIENLKEMMKILKETIKNIENK